RDAPTTSAATGLLGYRYDRGCRIIKTGRVRHSEPELKHGVRRDRGCRELSDSSRSIRQHNLWAINLFPLECHLVAVRIVRLSPVQPYERTFRHRLAASCNGVRRHVEAATVGDLHRCSRLPAYANPDGVAQTYRKAFRFFTAAVVDDAEDNALWFAVACTPFNRTG